MIFKKTLLDATYCAKAYIDEHYAKELTVAAIAKVAGVSAQTLRRGFKEEFGRTIYRYVTETRMKKAGDMLLTGERTIKEVAAAVGYRRINKFCAMFKSVFGVTPSEYRIDVLA